MNYLWCSVHTPTKEQIEELTTEDEVLEYLIDVDPELQNAINNTPGNKVDLILLARKLSAYSSRYIIVQPGGSPAFQFVFGHVISNGSEFDYHVLKVKYAHSERISVDKLQPDGSIVKTSVFKHIKFF